MMKFKITKQNLDFLVNRFDKNASGFDYIELEPEWETAKEAMAYQELSKEAFHRGYHYGFREGYFEGNKRENRDCFTRFCDERNCKFNY